MSAAIKTWQERIKNGAYIPDTKVGAFVVAYSGVAAQIFARDAEIADLRAALRAPVQAQGVAPDLYAAVARLIKCKGRHHTEQNYAAVVLAFDAAKPAQQDDALLDAAQGLLDVLDQYPGQLVPINRESQTVQILRAALTGSAT